MERALIVDDETFIAAMLEKLLDVLNIESVQAHDGKTALEELGRGGYHYLITDLMMPAMDGIELCRGVREDLGLDQLRIIMVTSKELSVDERKELMRMHVRIMMKPVSPAAFIESVRRYVEPNTV